MYKIEDIINKVHCADCLELMKDIPDKSVDLVLTDPPYGVNLDYDIYQDTEENWFKLMEKIIPEVKRVAKMVIMPSCQIKRLKWIYNHFPPDWLICWIGIEISPEYCKIAKERLRQEVLF